MEHQPEYDAKRAALQAVGRPDSSSEWIVVSPREGADAVRAGNEIGAVTVALANRGFDVDPALGGVVTTNADAVGDYAVLGFDGRTQTVHVTDEIED